MSSFRERFLEAAEKADAYQNMDDAGFVANRGNLFPDELRELQQDLLAAGRPGYVTQAQNLSKVIQTFERRARQIPIGIYNLFSKTPTPTDELDVLVAGIELKDIDGSESPEARRLRNAFDRLTGEHRKIAERANWRLDQYKQLFCTDGRQKDIVLDDLETIHGRVVQELRENCMNPGYDVRSGIALHHIVDGAYRAARELRNGN